MLSRMVGCGPPQRHNTVRKRSFTLHDRVRSAGPSVGRMRMAPQADALAGPTRQAGTMTTQTELHENPHPAPAMSDERMRARRAADEATAIARGTAVAAVILVVVAGVAAFFGLLQVSGLALFAAFVSSIASVAGRPTRGARWVGPTIIAVALVTVVVVDFVAPKL